MRNIVPQPHFIVAWEEVSFPVTPNKAPIHVVILIDEALHLTEIRMESCNWIHRGIETEYDLQRRFVCN